MRRISDQTFCIPRGWSKAVLAALIGAVPMTQFATAQEALGEPELIDSSVMADSAADTIEPIEAVADSSEPADTVPRADYDALIERIDALESGFEDYTEGVADAAAAAAKKAASRSSYKMTGRVHLDNWNFLGTDSGVNELEESTGLDDPFDRWAFRRARLEFSGAVPDNMIFRLQVDFNRPSTPEFKDVYIGFANLPNNQTLLIGNQKRPIGLDHLNSSRFNFFTERPFAVESFNEDARRLGIAMYGHSDDLSVNWRYGLFKLENLTNTGRIREDFEQGGLYGRLAGSPWYDDVSGGRGYLHLAVSGSVNNVSGGDVEGGTNDARFRTRPEARSTDRWFNTGRIAGANDYQQLGLETILNIGSIQTTAEYIFNPLQRSPAAGFSGEDLFFHGGYIYTSYYLTGEHIPYDRKTGTIGRLRPHENFFLVDRLRGGTGRGLGALGVGVRYSYIDLTDEDIFGGEGESVTLGINWHWTAYSKIQTNMIWGRVDNGGQNVRDTPFAGGGIDGDYSILGFRYMLDF